MKKLMLLAGLYCLQPTLHAAAWIRTEMDYVVPMSATDRAKAHFNENYAEAEDAVWYNLPDKTMYCIFHLGKKVDWVYYNSQGYWLYTQLAYPASVLTKKIKMQVLENFKGYHITYVNEIQSDKDEPIYIINIENADYGKVIWVEGENIGIKQDFEKQ
jgi:hypothetical protein